VVATRRLLDGPDARAEAARVLVAGGLVAVPTDTVYGIAVSLDTPGGIERLFAAKQRPPDRAVALLLADAAQAAEIGEMNESGSALAQAFWPGGLTLVVPRRGDRPLPVALTGADSAADLPTIGLRVPDHDAPRALARAVGPLPTTSANRSGEPEARDADELEAQVGASLDLILDGGPAHGGAASTVVDTTTEPVRILRQGAIGADEIDRCLTSVGLPGVGR
jgi:L-threonylcarbamoyladenylate synthase